MLAIVHGGVRPGYKCLGRLVFYFLCYVARAEDFTFFEKNIRPLLVEHCYKCHGAEPENLKGGLYLDSRDGMLKGGDTGPAIVPGKPEESLLLRAVEYHDEKLQMPPKQALPARDVSAIREWILSGAPDPRTNSTAISRSSIDYAAARQQWAFRKPVASPITTPRNTSWPRNGIDNFILAKLEANDLSPSPRADKHTLLRRVTFDLIGLPPTPKELSDFLADESPDALQTVVDRLLSSPLYGERWGRHWLDVVRYTDSLDARGAGGAGDISEAYRYRDWVVKAFNNDLPYDQFILQQFAGDLLQPASPELFDQDALIATTLFVIGEWGTGDADKEKMLTDIVDDQIDVTGRAFLGLTLACARCHDHKFDPISAADYYSLAGIFFSSHILPNPGVKTAGSPVLRLPLASPAELARRQAREERMKALETILSENSDRSINRLISLTLPQLQYYLAAVAEYKTSLDKGDILDRPTFATYLKLDPLIFERFVQTFGIGDLPLLAKFDRNIHGKTGLHSWSGASGIPSVTANTTDTELTYITIKMPPRSVAMHPSPNSAVAVAFKPARAGRYLIKAHLADVDPNCGNGIDWQINRRSLGALQTLAFGTMENGQSASILSTAHAGLADLSLSPGDWLEFSVGPRGDYSCDTTLVDLELIPFDDSKPFKLSNNIIANLAEGNTANPSAPWFFYDLGQESAAQKLAEGSKLQDWFGALQASDFSKLWSASAGLQKQMTDLASEMAAGKSLEELAKSPPGRLFQFLADPRSPFWAPLRETELGRTHKEAIGFVKARDELSALRRNPPPALEVTHGFQEGGVPESAHAGIKDARIHVRGRYDRLGDPIPRGFPKVLAGEDQPKITKGSGRLPLARWIASPENPLTARVIVNRIWHHHFGEGLVRTPNNFGKLGLPPTHPELLDWLASRFVQEGWSIKALHRLILASATWQQSSATSGQLQEKDPDNILLARMNRGRMEAEVLRDSILAVNGSLDKTLSGPPIRDLNSRRRTLYQMTIRSIRNDYRALFDAADPTAIVEKRLISTVAPQALFMLNHPFIIAETRRLAQRVLDQTPRADDERIRWLYRTLFAREPSLPEYRLAKEALDAIYNSSSSTFPEREIAAWESYCQLLLSSNEFFYID